MNLTLDLVIKNTSSSISHKKILCDSDTRGFLINFYDTFFLSNEV